MSDPIQTRLTPEQERVYQIWRAELPKRLQYEGDYDLRGAYMGGAAPSPPLALEDGAHLTDQWKLPSHPTFSVESVYSPLAPAMAGSWRGETYQPSVVRTIADLLARGPAR